MEIFESKGNPSVTELITRLYIVVCDRNCFNDNHINNTR